MCSGMVMVAMAWQPEPFLLRKKKPMAWVGCAVGEMKTR
jgi:hypothetical protein